MGVLAVEFAADLAVEHELRHGRRGFGAARLVVLRRGQTVEPDRQAADLDRVAVSNMGDVSDQRPAMAIPLPLPPGIEARALVHHLLEHGVLVGVDTAGRAIIQLAVDDWVLEGS